MAGQTKRSFSDNLKVYLYLNLGTVNEVLKLEMSGSIKLNHSFFYLLKKICGFVQHT